MKIILHILVSFYLTFLNVESSILYWRYSVKLSIFQTFLIQAAIDSCFVIFWFWLSGKIITLATKWQKNKRLRGKKYLKKILLKIARWIVKKRNYYKNYKNKKMVKRLNTWGLPGIYLYGFIPCFAFFLIGLSIQKLSVQSRLGPWCLWLGVMTRVGVSVFAGLKLVDFLIKLIT